VKYSDYPLLKETKLVKGENLMNTHFKKFRRHLVLTLLLLVLGALVITACSPVEEVTLDTPEEEQPQDQEPTIQETEAETSEEPSFPSYDPINMLIPEQPWLTAMQELVKQYQEETGNVVNINVTPFQGMVQKSVNSVQAPEGEFDIIVLNEALATMFYASQWAIPFHEIDPDYKLDPEIISYDNASRWDPELGVATPDGAIYSAPINGNVQLFFYRADLYEENELEIPETWQDVESAAETLAATPNIYGYAALSNPPNISTMVFIKGYGGNLLDYDYDSGIWAVTVNDDAAVMGIREWLRLASTYGPPNWQSLSQAEMMSLMASGKLAQGVMISSVAEDINNPEKSIVSGNVAATVVPRPVDGKHAAITGIWLLIIPHNTVEANQPAALAFIDWATTKEAQMTFAHAGGTPVRTDVYEELQDDPELGWWMSAIYDTIPYMHTLPKTPHIESVLNPYINSLSQMIAGDLTVEEALDQAAQLIYDSLTNVGLKVAPLDE
jgi:multiple sugar transport system substrate-binding protein